jgi:hypothetical protein
LRGPTSNIARRRKSFVYRFTAIDKNREHHSIIIFIGRAKALFFEQPNLHLACNNSKKIEKDDLAIRYLRKVDFFLQ